MRLCFYVSLKNNLFNIVTKPFSVFDKGNFAIGLSQKETEKFLNDGVLIHLAYLENSRNEILSDLETFNKYISEFHEMNINPNQNSQPTENYLTLNETLAYLKKSLDLSVYDPINFLERNIKQGIIIPYFEFFGFINFETPSNDYTTVIQIDEVHGFFKDWNFNQPNNEFTNLSKDKYQIVCGKVENIIFSDCLKFYGCLKNGDVHFEPNKSIEVPKDITVTFHSIRPNIDYETLIVRDNLQTRENNKVYITNNAIHFKLIEINNLISQNSHLKIKQISHNDELFGQVVNQQVIIDSLNQELEKLRAELLSIKQQAGKETTPTHKETPANNEPLLKGIAKVNYEKAIAQNFARIVAKFLWSMDTNQQIKSGDMANQIYALLLEFNNEATPETADRIKEWLTEITPTYAKQAGRPPKDQPKEITLTLKK